jgi:signal transduction histidine kinase
VNQLAFAIIGLLAGIILCALLVASSALAYLTFQTRKDLLQQRAMLLAALQHASSSITKLESTVLSSLASLDAERLHEASQGVQRGAKQLLSAVGTMSKLLYENTGAETVPGALDPADQDYTRGMDPARRLDEYGEPSYTPLDLDSLSPESQQAAGITSVDLIAFQQARREGRRQIQEERERIARDQQIAAQKRAASAITGSDTFTQAREALLRAGIDPLSVYPASTMTEAVSSSRPGALPDLGEDDPGVTFTEGE